MHPDNGAIPSDKGVMHPDSGAILPDKNAMHPDSGVILPDSAAIFPNKGAIRQNSRAIGLKRTSPFSIVPPVIQAKLPVHGTRRFNIYAASVYFEVHGHVAPMFDFDCRYRGLERGCHVRFAPMFDFDRRYRGLERGEI
jgi:hypothetical protein